MNETFDFVHDEMSRPSSSGTTGATADLAAVAEDDHDQVMTVDEFRVMVKEYLNADSFLKRARALCKEKRERRDELAEKIKTFMERYSLEDIKTNEARLRCKKTTVKKTANRQTIRERLEAQGIDTEILDKIFEEPAEVSEKTSLRRLKPT